MRPITIEVVRLKTRSGRVLSTLLATCLLAGCDLAVINPGPMQDEFLNQVEAHEAVVQGMAMSLSPGLDRLIYIGSEAAMEYTQAGRLHGTKLPVVPGQLTHQSIPAVTWNWPQRARWIAEDGVRRIEASDPDASSSVNLARALLYAGYTNRILGENMCEAVIDTGPVEPIGVHFERAEAYFTRAIEVGTTAGDQQVQQAALAGRAAVRLFVGEYSAAASDATQVPESFVFEARYSSAEVDQYNFIYHVNNGAPFRAHSVVDTYYDAYYLETGDPRVRWQNFPPGEVIGGDFAWVPWFPQLKYTSESSSINLSSGREMRLVEAEAALRAGDWEGAMLLINGLRTSLVSDVTGEPLAEWESDNLEEAWTALKRERGVELWLEGRRLGDLRRWIDNDAPGDMEDMSTRIRLCFPISNTERQTNPSIALDHEDPTNPLFTGLPALPADIDYSDRF